MINLNVSFLGDSRGSEEEPFEFQHQRRSSDGDLIASCSCDDDLLLSATMAVSSAFHLSMMILGSF